MRTTWITVLLLKRNIGSLVLNPPQNLSLLFNQFNSLSEETNLHDDNVDKINNCKYYDAEQVQILKIPKNFHINVCSLNKIFEDLEYLFKSTNINYDIAVISETKTMKILAITKNINFKNYNFEYTPTESTAGGTTLCVGNHLAYVPSHDLKFYKTNELESIFIEFINSKKQNVLVGCIYRHSSMNQNEFNKYHLNNLLGKLVIEKKTVFLLGNFNISFLEYEKHNPANECLDSLSGNMFLPYILVPTRTSSNSKTLIDNIFSNFISNEVIKGNLTATIFDHLPQFLIALDIFCNPQANKTNIFERN